MPLFAFTCQACGNDSELLVRGEESPACPACDSTRMEKQLSRFAPMQAQTASPMPVGCGAPQCCRMQGGGCAN